MEEFNLKAYLYEKGMGDDLTVGDVNYLQPKVEVKKRELIEITIPSKFNNEGKYERKKTIRY